MSDPKTKSLLDLIPSGPIRSRDPFLFKGQQVRWRLLDGLEVMACRSAAERREVRRLVDEFGIEAKDAYTIVGAGMDGQREWFEYYMIGAAMTDEHGDPISMDSPDDIALSLADKCTPIERAKFMSEYLEFADEHDPSNLSDEDEEEIIAALGKGDDSILSQRGSSWLRSLCASMAPRLVKAEMAVASLEDELADLREQEDLAARVEELERAISQMRKSTDGSG